MGCGASSNNALTTVARVLSASGEPMKNKESDGSLKIATDSPDETRKVLLSSHSSQRNIGERLQHVLLDQHRSCFLVDEVKPQSLAARANAVQWCDVFVVLISRSYQRSAFCMEMLNYAKDVRKPIISIQTESCFQPYGALGAISASAIQCIDFSNGTSFESVVSGAVGTIDRLPMGTKPAKLKTNTFNPLQVRDNDTITELTQDSSIRCDVLICTSDDGNVVGQLIYEFLTSAQLSVLVNNLSKLDAACHVTGCTVFVPVLTPELERTSVCRTAFEQARLLCKPIVPVIAVNKWRPEGWLGLAIAGRVFFRIFDRESAYKPFYDSNRITDLRVSIETACQSMPGEDERERIEKSAIRKCLDEYKSKLSAWPPKRKSRVGSSTEVRRAVRIQLPEPHADSYFDHTHHSITRMSFNAPPAVIDQHGLPKRRYLDCMISYQWDKQELVRQVYEDLHMRRVQTWFDIWGSMQGSTNDAMATGVECAKVILVFLSNEYITSANCQLEFRYALKRGKAFVVLRTEPNISIEPWMHDAIDGFPQYDVFSYAVLEGPINGVPLIDVIVQAIRLLAQAQPPDIVDDCSAELSELRSLLDDARDALSAETGEPRYKKCTRCGQEYDEYSKDGCKKHAEYFLGGGGLLEDQWVCCRQQTADSPGCVPCEHISEPRVFVKDPHYGSSVWKPA